MSVTEKFGNIFNAFALLGLFLGRTSLTSAQI